LAGPTLAVSVTFKSALSTEELMKVLYERIDQFRALTGLKQKYYLHNEATDEWTGLYLWDGPASFKAFAESELRASIAAAYQAIGEPQVKVFKIVETLRPS